jgi:hypothetical protein
MKYLTLLIALVLSSPVLAQPAPKPECRSISDAYQRYLCESPAKPECQSLNDLRTINSI